MLSLLHARYLVNVTHRGVLSLVRFVPCEGAFCGGVSSLAPETDVLVVADCIFSEAVEDLVLFVA